MFRLLPLLVATMMFTATAAAQAAQLRTLDVPVAALWQHAETQMILPPRVEGLARLHLRDTTDDEMDVVATYADRADGMIALVYIYRTMTPDVSLWFDRTLATVMLPQAGAVSPAVTAFVRPGASSASGLRAVMTDSRSGMRSTAVAIAPLGSYWLVKVRLGSTKLDPAGLDERLSTFMAALRWPPETRTAGLPFLSSRARRRYGCGALGSSRPGPRMC